MKYFIAIIAVFCILQMQSVRIVTDVPEPEIMEQTAKMRYFLFTYSYSTSSNGWGNGSVNIQSDTFPNQTWVLDYIEKNNGYDREKIVFVNIHEFKSKADYDNFLKK